MIFISNKKRGETKGGRYRPIVLPVGGCVIINFLDADDVDDADFS